MSSLRTLRTDKKLALETVAKDIDIDASNLSRIERGLQFPNRKTIKSLAKYYDKAESEIYALVISSSTPEPDQDAA